MRLGIGLCVWAAMLWGVLRVANLPGDWGHGICGPWGCGPPLQALVACHGFWLVLTLPIVCMLISGLSPHWRIRLGVGLFLTGVAGLTAIVVYQAVVWLPDALPFQRAYFPQRCLFVLATLVDWPVVPLLLSGTVLCLSGWLACWVADMADRHPCGTGVSTARVLTARRAAANSHVSGSGVVMHAADYRDGANGPPQEGAARVDGAHRSTIENQPFGLITSTHAIREKECSDP